MIKHNILIPALFCLLIFSCQSDGKQGQKIKTDICILSGSEAGITAAIQAARLGEKVILIEPTGHPGGMMMEGIVKDIQEMDYSELRKTLVENGQILEIPEHWLEIITTTN